MPTIKDASRALGGLLGEYKRIPLRRSAVMGDGRGSAASNIVAPIGIHQEYVYVRDGTTSTRFYTARNSAGVPLTTGLPVIVELNENGENQIVSVDTDGLGTDLTNFNIPKVGLHAHQHGFKGGDDVFLDSRQVLVGLVYPTTPPSMQVKIGPFVHFYNGWKRYDGGTSISLSTYIPETGQARFVTIALDPETNTIVYRPGGLFAYGLYAPEFSQVQSPAGNEIPLGFVYLTSGIAQIDFSSTNNFLGDGRLMVNAPMLNILDRLRQLEGYTGNDPNLATTGAAASSTDDKAISVYRVEALTTDREYAASATTLGEVANVLGTLIVDLRNRNVIG